MKIIITGATGSLGAYLTRYYYSKGHQVIASGKTDNPPKKMLQCASYFKADITVPFKFPDADVCIHTAALSDDKGNKSDLYKANAIGTKHVIDAASACKKFIHISSSSVYLPHNKPITEDMAGKQNNKKLSLYGYSKLQSEDIVLDKSKHDYTYILRPRAFYGVGDKVILPRLLKLVKQNEIQKPGDMNINISMTHYLNIAHAIDCCVNAKNKGMHIYNVGDEENYVLIDIIRKLTNALYGRKLPEKKISIAILRLMSLFKINGITSLLIRSLTQDMVLDISKIKNELNYKAQTDFDSSLNNLKEWVNHIGGVDVIKAGNKKLAWE